MISIKSVEVGTTEDKIVFEAVVFLDDSCLIRIEENKWMTTAGVPIISLNIINSLETVYKDYIKHNRVLH